MMKKSQKNTASNSQLQGTKKSYNKELYQLLYKQPISRRMAATQLGFNDQTYMVTQFIMDWIKLGKAAVIGKIKCTRSNRFVEAVTTNPALFPKSIQYKLELFKLC